MDRYGENGRRKEDRQEKQEVQSRRQMGSTPGRESCSGRQGALELSAASGNEGGHRPLQKKPKSKHKVLKSIAPQGVEIGLEELREIRKNK